MIMEYYWEGRYAYMNGARYEDNPFFVDTMHFQSWRMGWLYAQSLVEGT
jgi:hypothetical protein